MDQFWSEADEASHPNTYVPPSDQGNAQDLFGSAFEASTGATGNTLNGGTKWSNQVDAVADNQFDQFEQDEAGKRIRKEEELVNERLREKSECELAEKLERKEKGRVQYAEFLQRKEAERKERIAENLVREAKLQAGMKEMRTGEGWGKVAANINSKQGEYKGKKDVNRMREAILHRLDDDSR